MRARKPYLHLWQKLAEHKAMIFLTGPRQSGKTTFAQSLSREYSNYLYFNWDILAQRKQLLKDPNFFEHMDRRDNSVPLVVLDEVHKYRHWKNYLKGVFDQHNRGYKFLVSGSGRLDIFQKGGDSLAGRYFLMHFWPLTLAELSQSNLPYEDFFKNPLLLAEKQNTFQDTWVQLSRLSGFPEPFFAGDEAHYRRWSQIYGQQLIKEDIRDMTNIKDIDSAQNLFALLPDKIASPLSINSLAGDLQVSYTAVKEWLDIFERFFLVFRISPWSQKISRALTKGKKLYLFDYPLIQDEAARFENMVAVELWRAVSHWNDLGHGRFQLHYLRNKEKEEVDFLVTNQYKPMLLVEVKLNNTAVALPLIKFQNFLDVPAVQLVNRPNIYKIISNQNQKVMIVTASHWLAGVP